MGFNLSSIGKIELLLDILYIAEVDQGEAYGIYPAFCTQNSWRQYSNPKLKWISHLFSCLAATGFRANFTWYYYSRLEVCIKLSTHHLQHWEISFIDVKGLYFQICTTRFTGQVLLKSIYIRCKFKIHSISTLIDDREWIKYKHWLNHYMMFSMNTVWNCRQRWSDK